MEYLFRVVFRDRDQLPQIKGGRRLGFFTFVKPPDVEETGRYNRAVGTLWFVAAGIFEMIGIPLMFLQQNSPLFLLIIFAVIILLIGMMVVYTRIEARYRKK